MLNLEKLKTVTLEPCYLGGTGRKFFITIDGKKYIYKPAEDRYYHQKEPFRGLVQEAAYKIQNIIDSETSVYCTYVDNGILQGSIQEYIDIKNPNLLFFEPKDLTESQINDVLREFVTDFLLCNYDCHANNMIIDQNGRIRGIDKEQSFRYINRQEAERPNLSFHPNQKYGELPPYYYAFFQAVKEKEIDINLDVLNSYLDKVDALDNSEFQEILNPYIEALPITKEEKQALQEKILYRKINMRDNINQFIDSLDLQRKK